MLEHHHAAESGTFVPLPFVVKSQCCSGTAVPAQLGRHRAAPLRHQVLHSTGAVALLPPPSTLLRSASKFSAVRGRRAALLSVKPCQQGRYLHALPLSDSSVQEDNADFQFHAHAAHSRLHLDLNHYGSPRDERSPRPRHKLQQSMPKNLALAGGGSSPHPEDELVRLIFSWSLQDIMNRDFLADKVKTIPDRFSGLMGYLAAFRFPPAGGDTNGDERQLSGLHSHTSAAGPERQVRRANLPVERYRLFVGRRGRRGARNFPCTGDVVLLSDATSRCRRPADLSRNGRSCCLAHVVYAFAFEIVASERIDQALPGRSSVILPLPGWSL
ncbi:hypothetical protein HU200_013340 [Digitaria exilis]|uniref:Uncharacterized protein n=1 Tax=Digitaria exilis TaxID=1010633 RepID=A0A835FD74_9POAL|nr:hypothetical protein HU200_013340 [Digitaria exilis]